jgi:type IV pilus assembly protein PilM
MNLSFGFGSQSFLVIDPGRHTLKVGVGSFGAKGKKAKLHSVYTARTGATPQTQPDEVIERTGELLQEIIKRHSLSAQQVLFALPGRASFVRQLRIPKVSGDRLQRLIQYEARQQIPFSLDEIILDSHVFSGEEPELGVTLVAIRRTIIDQYCGMLKTAGLVPDVIDVATLSLFNAYFPYLKEQQTEMAALVDIGASTTDIIVCKKGRVEFIRPAPLAGDTLTKVLSDQMSLPWDQAEELKIELGKLDPSIDRQTDPLAFGEADQAARVRVFLSKGFDAIVNEIRRTLDFYVSQPDGEPIEKVMLTGGTSRIPGLAEFVESRLNIPCEVLHPFDTTLVDVHSLDADPLQNSCSVLLGLCQRNIEDVPLRMNFLPPAIVRRKEFEKRRMILIAEAVMLAGLIAVSVVSMHRTISVFQAATDSLENNIDGRGETATRIREYIDSTRKLEDRVTILRDIGRSRGVIAQTLAEIAEKLPLGETWITGMEMDTTDIRMQVRGVKEDSINIFKSNMTEVNRVRKDFSVKDVKRLSEGGIEFQLQGEVEKDPSPELSKLREKLETRSVKFYEVALDKDSSGGALISVTVPKPFGDSETGDTVMGILRAIGDAELGFENKTVDIVFNNTMRQMTGKYSIRESDVQALLQGAMDVGQLTIKPQ